MPEYTELTGDTASVALHAETVAIIDHALARMADDVRDAPDAYRPDIEAQLGLAPGTLDAEDVVALMDAVGEDWREEVSRTG